MIKLSQCMIVKNEEANIEKALSWAKDIAYEQIVVDTGSTDRTVEIAEKMGAKVYHFEWIDDFSAAKNYTLSKATGDWIAFLDADEYFEEEDAKKLMAYLEELKDSKYVAILTSLINLDENGKPLMSCVQNRIFRNMENLRYQNAIHEFLILKGKIIENFCINLTKELSIFHTGYAYKGDQKEKKAERNIQILLKELEKDPENKSLMGYLGSTYLSIGNSEEGVKWLEKSIDSLKTSVGIYDMVIPFNFLNLMKALRRQNNAKRLLEVYEQAIQVVPAESDFDYFMSFYWIEVEKNFEKAVFHLEQAFQKLEANRESFYGQTLLKNIKQAWEMRITCYYRLHNWIKCMENSILLLKEDAYHFDVTSMLLDVFRIDEAKGGANANAVLQFLSQLYSLQSLKDRIYLLKAAMRVHYDSLVLELRNLFTPEELAAIDGSIGK